MPCSRYMWELTRGRIPDGMVVMHTCDNPACVNPSHLRLGTITDNNRDRALKGRSRDQRGEKHNMVKLTEQDVRDIRASKEKYPVLAKRYGVCTATICVVRNGKSWRHVK